VRVIVRFLIAIVVLLAAIVVVIGPGKIVAGVEYPFGVGPWSSTGRYCHDIYDLMQLVDEYHHSDRMGPTPTELTALHSYEKTLTKTGPHVPRADFTAFFRTSGKVVKRMTSEGKLINTWWNQNCADPLMNTSASANNVLSGLVSHEKFTHYPKNIVKVPYFFKVMG
jgi:hypothetical protein